MAVTDNNTIAYSRKILFNWTLVNTRLKLAEPRPKALERESLPFFAADF